MKREWEGVEPEYLRGVNYYLENNEDVNIPNPGVDHAKFMIYNLISSAKDSIKIFAANLSRGIYDDERILEAARNSPVERIEVLYDGDLNSVEFSGLDKVDVKKVVLTDELKEKIPGHFIVVDSKRFRFEQYIDRNDLRDNTKGIVNFNDVKTSESMDVVFSRLKSC